VIFEAESMIVIDTSLNILVCNSNKVSDVVGIDTVYAELIYQ
jgi:hypothetical protein